MKMFTTITRACANAAYRLAVARYRKAAEQGLADAQNNLGLMYEEGEGVLQNYVQAYAWFGFAAAQGNTDASEAMARLRDRMTPKQVAEARAAAADAATER